MIDLITYLPEFLREVSEFVIIQNSISSEVNLAISCLDNMQKQKFIQTSSGFGLQYWEKEYGIASDDSLSDVLRRENIIAKIRGMGTITKLQLKNIAKSYSGSEVEIIELSSEYKIVIKFVGTKGIPKNMPGLKQTLSEIMPAHIAYDFSYLYNTWGMVNHLSWGSVVAKSWYDLMIYEEVTT